MPKFISSHLFKLMLGLLLLILSTTGCGQTQPAPTPAKGVQAVTKETSAAKPTEAPMAAKPSEAPQAKAGSTPSGGKVYKWTLATSTPFASVPAIGQFADAIEAVSAGQIKITKLDVGQHPYAPSDLLTVVRDRKTDLTAGMAVYVDGVEPILGMWDLPFMFDSDSEFYAVMDDPAYKELRSQAFDSVMDKWNGRSLAFWAYPDIAIIEKDTFLDSLDSLKGKKMRVNTEPLSGMMTTLGATPVTIAVAEVYPSLQRGVISGFTSSFVAFEKLKVFDMMKAVTLSENYLGYMWMMLNKDSFAELPPDLQKIVLNTAAQQQKTVRQGNVDDMKAVVDKLKKQGVGFKELSPAFRDQLRTAMRPIWDKAAGRVGAQGLNAVERLNDFHKEWRKTH